MELSNYTITDNIEEATAWIAYHDNDSVVKELIIPNKIYELIDHDFILSEDMNLTTYWMCHKGDFIIMKEN